MTDVAEGPSERSGRSGSTSRRPTSTTCRTASARTRWAEELPADTFAAPSQTGPVAPGWEYGVPLEYVKDRVDYWRDGYDWREWEERLNALPAVHDDDRRADDPLRPRALAGARRARR